MAQAAMREGFVSEDEPKVTPLKTETVPPQIEQAPAAPGVPAEPNPYVSQWPMRVKLLFKPIRNNNNEEISEVAFREPTGADINRYGSPVRLNADGVFDIEDKKMAMVMAALSGINLPFLERMDPRDWNACAYRLRLYFQPETGGWL